MQPNSELKCNFLVMKIASRCNLNCTYCIMYNVGDLSYKNQPKVMSDAVVDALLDRVKTHCRRHGIDKFDFSFHGGEPLLAGPDFFRKFVAKANARLLPAVTPSYTLQTNGTLLTEDWCRLFGELDISIAVSLDGTPEANDMYRIDHAGRGSYDKIRQGFSIAKNSKHLRYVPNVLSVINVQSDPLEVYRHFRQLGVTGIDFILPHATHDQPPAGFAERKPGDTPYADWLIAVFDHWFVESKPKPSIRFFDFIIASILGFDAPFEYLGIQRNEILIVETDGGIEPVDSLKACGEGFTKVGANVLTHHLDSAFDVQLARLYNLSHQMLCKQCSHCPVRHVCGGGFLPDRYSKATGFNNPSVYCADLMKVITHIQNRVLDHFPADMLDKLGLAPLSYEEARTLLRDGAAGEDEPWYALELEAFRQG